MTPPDHPGEPSAEPGPDVPPALAMEALALVSEIRARRHDVMSMLHGVLGFAELMGRDRYRTNPDKHAELGAVVIRRGQEIHELLEGWMKTAADILARLPTPPESSAEE